MNFIVTVECKTSSRSEIQPFLIELIVFFFPEEIDRKHSFPFQLFFIFFYVFLVSNIVENCTDVQILLGGVICTCIVTLVKTNEIFLYSYT